MFQEYALFPWLTVFDNIAYGLRLKGMGAAECTAIVERLRGADRPGRVRAAVPARAVRGMKQRVALARTFAYEPDILLLDEPFGALDSQTRELMQEELLRLWRGTGKTILMVTHDVSEAVYLSTRICVIVARPGRMVQEFAIGLDRGTDRETLVLSSAYTDLHNAVWLAVRHQVHA